MVATGSLGSGTMTVASIVDASTITVSSTATFTAGTVSNLSTRFSSTTSGFKWRDVVALRVYSNVETASDYSGSGTSEFAISLDAIRFENKSNTNPLYGLVAYMDAYSTSEVIKKSGEVSLVEFKVGLGIQHGI
jgi:hypothetical protein